MKDNPARTNRPDTPSEPENPTTYHTIDLPSITPEQIDEILEFYNEGFGVQRTPAEWMWQYGTFRPELTVFTVARNGGRIIATQAMMPIWLRVGGNRVLTGKAESTLLHPEFRGIKAMEPLYAYAIEESRRKGMRFLWAYTGAFRAARRWGYDDFPVTRQYLRPGLNFPAGFGTRISIRAPLWRRVASGAKFTLEYLRALTYASASRPPVPSGLAVSREPVRPKETLELYQRLRSRQSDLIAIDFDDEYLDWRLRKHPFRTYEDYQVRDRESLRGYAWVSFLGGTLSISELCAETGEATALLLREIIADHARKAGQFMVMLNAESCLTPQTADVLTRFGFISKHAIPFIHQDLSDGQFPEINDLANWNFSGLWTEGYAA